MPTLVMAEDGSVFSFGWMLLRSGTWLTLEGETPDGAIEALCGNGRSRDVMRLTAGAENDNKNG